MSVTASSSTRIFGYARRPQDVVQAGAVARPYGNHAITIETHADERGTREYNLAVGARTPPPETSWWRAMAGKRLKTISCGKELHGPVCDDISCWSDNCRAVTVLNGVVAKHGFISLPPGAA